MQYPEDPHRWESFPEISNSVDWEQGRWSRRGDRSRPGTPDYRRGLGRPSAFFGPQVDADPEAVYGDLLPGAAIRPSAHRQPSSAPLTDLERPAVKSGAVLKGGPGHVRGLTAVPFELADPGETTMCSIDGVEAFPGRPRSSWETHGIRAVGAGLTPEEAFKPQVLDLNGIRLGIVNIPARERT